MTVVHVVEDDHLGLGAWSNISRKRNGRASHKNRLDRGSAEAQAEVRFCSRKNGLTLNSLHTVYPDGRETRTIGERSRCLMSIRRHLYILERRHTRKGRR